MHGWIHRCRDCVYVSSQVHASDLMDYGRAKSGQRPITSYTSVQGVHRLPSGVLTTHVERSLDACACDLACELYCMLVATLYMYMYVHASDLMLKSSQSSVQHHHAPVSKVCTRPPIRCAHLSNPRCLSMIISKSWARTKGTLSLRTPNLT